MDRNKISLLQQFIQSFTFFSAVSAETGIGNIGIISNDFHTESLQPGSDKSADTSQTDDAQSFAQKLAAFQAAAVPDSGFDHFMSLDHVAGRAQQQADSMLGCRYDIGFRRVNDYNAALRSTLHLDIVDTVAGTAHYL